MAAAAAKERGNSHFKAGNFRAAVAAFSDAIVADPSDAIFWSNRSARGGLASCHGIELRITVCMERTRSDACRIL